MELRHSKLRRFVTERLAQGWPRELWQSPELSLDLSLRRLPPSPQSCPSFLLVQFSFLFQQLSNGFGKMTLH